MISVSICTEQCPVVARHCATGQVAYCSSLLDKLLESRKPWWLAIHRRKSDTFIKQAALAMVVYSRLIPVTDHLAVLPFFFCFALLRSRGFDSGHVFFSFFF